MRPLSEGDTDIPWVPGVRMNTDLGIIPRCRSVTRFYRKWSYVLVDVLSVLWVSRKSESNRSLSWVPVWGPVYDCS